MSKTLADIVIRYRWWVILASLISVLLIASGGRFIEFSTSYRVFFAEDNPQLQAFEVLQDTYTKSDNVLFVIEPKDGNIFSKEILSLVQQLTEDAWQITFSTRVDSLSNFQHTESEEDDLLVQDLVEEPTALTPAAIARIREVALNEPLLINRLVSPSGDITAVNVTLQFPELSPTETDIVVSEVRALAAKYDDANDNIKIYLTGVTMMNNAFSESSKDDMASLIPTMFLVVIVTLLIMLRSIVGTLGTVITIIFSILTGMGLLGWLGLPMTPPVSSAPTIILTMAVADSVHLLVTFFHQMHKGLSRHEAIKESIRVNFQPIFITSLTTAIGFLSMNFSEVPPFNVLGNVVALGVIAAFIYSVTFLPAFLAVIPIRVKVSESEDKHIYMQKLANLVIEKRNLMFFSVGAFTLISIAFIPRIELNDEFVKYFDSSVQFRTDTDFTNERLTGIYTIEYSLKNTQTGAISDPQFLNQVEALANWLREKDNLVHVNSITDTFKRLNKNLHGDDPNRYVIPEQQTMAAQYLLLYEMSLPYGLDLNNQLDIDKSATRLVATFINMSSQEVLALEEEIAGWMASNAPNIEYHGSSPTLMFSHIGIRNVESMINGIILALILISIIMIWALKSLRLGLISLAPNLIPAAIGFGVWGMLVAEVGMSIASAVGMILGIVVDDSVHFLSKYQRARHEQNLSSEAAVRYAFSTVGVALWVTTFVLVAGFLILAQSDFKFNSDMGLFTALVIFTALVVDFLFLPPLLMRLDKDSKDPSKQPADTKGATA